MPGQRPTLVASCSPIGDQIQSFVAESSGRPVRRFSFDDCREHLAWNRPGLLMLVAASDGDWEPLAGLAREAALRHSPMTVVVVHAADLDDGGALDRLTPLSSARLPWPGAAEEIGDAVRAAPGGADASEGTELADRLVALTPSLAPMADRLALAAAHDLTVLLSGETGTGKTFLARLLHEYSPRRNHPFLMVPCGAQSANLFESCFFGHVKGAFTSAHQTQRGKFAAAGKGTILLDEIDTLGVEQQASLLRVIETGEYEQVGGHVTLRSEARLIAASNWDLEVAVEQGRFRQDLYYRINVLSFHLAPLRERPQDVGPLARAFVAHFAARFSKPLVGIAPDALAALEAHPWPGNIRQLENSIQQAVLVCRGNELTARDLPEAVRHADPLRGGPAVGAVAPRAAVPTRDPGLAQTTARAVAGGDARPSRTGTTLLQSRADYERRLIQKALEECQFNRSSAARALGVSRVTLHKKIKQYGLADLP